jgi:hypothetical protein
MRSLSKVKIQYPHFVNSIITPKRLKNEKAMYLDQCSLVSPFEILLVKLSKIKENPRTIKAIAKKVEKLELKNLTEIPFFNLSVILEDIDSQIVF